MLVNYEYAFIALGANLPSKVGSPIETVKFAIAQFSSFSQHPLLVSTLYEAAPVDCPPESDQFINAVIGLKPDEKETAASLFKKLQSLEVRCERTRSGVVNESRTLDLDLITFKKVQCDTPDLILPHPRSHERRFVLEPLIEISGDWVMPGYAISLKEMLKKVAGQEIQILK